MTMETVCDDKLYFWHVFFGIVGCNNDITVLESSPLHASVANCTYILLCKYDIDGFKRNELYWISDGMYPKAPCLLHSILNPYDEFESYYASRQEGRRKDIERAFGVLRAKFHLVALPCRLWKT